MAIVAIVPAKVESQRVPHKNYRDFHKGDSLVDVTVTKLKAAGFTGDRIFLSAEPHRLAELAAAKHGINYIERDERLCRNDTPIPDYIRGVVQKATALTHYVDDDILWAQVCDPLFNEYPKIIDAWCRRAKGYDSLTVVYPRKKYLLDQNRCPIGWGFGPWHKRSQLLPTLYEMPLQTSILSQRAIEATGYYVGVDPFFYEAEGQSIDIDNEFEFQAAAAMYAAQRNG